MQCSVMSKFRSDSWKVLTPVHDFKHSSVNSMPKSLTDFEGVKVTTVTHHEILRCLSIRTSANPYAINWIAMS